MRKNKTPMRFFLIAVMLLITTISNAQEEIVVRDLETWSSVNLVHKLNKRWTVDGQLQFRLKDNSSVLDQYFGQIGAEYSPFKRFSFAAGLRYATKNDNTGGNQGYKDRFRYQLDGSFKHKLNDFKFKYRLRYQNRKELGLENEDEVAKQAVRLKAAVDYNIKKWKLDPEFSAELFRGVGEESSNDFDSYRITLGTSFKIHKSADIAVYYRFEEELNVDYPKAVNIIGFKYIYNLK